MKKIQDYSFQKKIGSGSFGSVYLGTNSKNQKVAIKEIFFQTLNAKAKELLKSEIKLLEKLNHPGIINCEKVIYSSKFIYIITEYCEGGDLDDFVTNNGPVPYTTVKKWLKSLLSTLLWLKDQKIIHRDLKLANLLLTEASPEGEIKLCDFGFAKTFDNQFLATTKLGTPAYMAPEIFSASSYDYKIDIWSAGVIAYELLFGQLPFHCKTINELKTLQLQPLRIPNTQAPPSALNLIQKMLTVNPQLRPSYEELLQSEFFSEENALIQISNHTICEGLKETEEFKNLDSNSSSSSSGVKNEIEKCFKEEGVKQDVYSVGDNRERVEKLDSDEQSANFIREITEIDSEKKSFSDLQTEKPSSKFFPTFIDPHIENHSLIEIPSSLLISKDLPLQVSRSSSLTRMKKNEEISIIPQDSLLSVSRNSSLIRMKKEEENILFQIGILDAKIADCKCLDPEMKINKNLEYIVQLYKIRIYEIIQNIVKEFVDKYREQRFRELESISSSNKVLIESISLKIAESWESSFNSNENLVEVLVDAYFYYKDIKTTSQKAKIVLSIGYMLFPMHHLVFELYHKY